MEVKFFEIRFGSAFIPALAIRLFPRTQRERYILYRAGARPSQVLLTPLRGEFPSSKHFLFTVDYVERHWDDISSGVVIDIDYLTGDRDKPRFSESVHDREYNGQGGSGHWME